MWPIVNIRTMSSKTSVLQALSMCVVCLLSMSLLSLCSDIQCVKREYELLKEPNNNFYLKHVNRTT